MEKNKNVLAEIWLPDYLIPDNREDQVRIILRKLVFYLIFVVLFSFVIYAMIPPLLYTFTQALKKQFVLSKFECQPGTLIDFQGIQTANDVWMYLQTVLVDNLYNDYWYSYHLKIKPTDPDDNKVLYENALLGLPRIRQHRVKNDSCSIHDNFKKSFANCYAYYSFFNADEGSFQPTNTSTENTAWQYNEASQFIGVPYMGVVSTYPQGGFYHDLSYSRNETIAIIEDLMNNLWITRSTRVIFVDFAVYNININMFCVIKLVFEFPPTGGVIPTSTFSSHKFIRYKSRQDFIVLGCEIICIFFFLVYSIDEIREWKHYGKVRFHFFWTYINTLFLLLAYAIIGACIFRMFFVNKQIRTIEINPDVYINFATALTIRNTGNNFLAIDLFITWIKIFKFLNLSQTFGQLARLLKMCYKDIIGFGLMFFIIFFAFAQMGYLLFGSQIEAFSTFGGSVMTLLITILGEFDYYEIERTNKALAPIFFTTYIFFVFFVLFNMFLAIITDTYCEIKTELKLKQSELEISEFLARAPKNLIWKMKKREPRSTITPVSAKMLIARIRDILKLCNFTELEIKIFLSMNNIDEDRMTNEDVARVIKQIRSARADRGIVRRDPSISPDMFIRQQERLQNLTDDIRQLRQKVDSIKIKRPK